ncbi:S26 family signal peptidase [Glycocaulis profundi]|nr:S26 family signal peptidase [Glycocaulis profundi]
MPDRRARTGLAAALACAALAAPCLMNPAPRLVWNPSASAPVGLWRVAPGQSVVVGDMALAWPPEPYRQLAAERGYLPGNVPLLKRVAAVEGDRVCGVGEALSVNGRIVARRRAADARGRLLPRWSGCRTLAPDEILLLMDAADSFDGRYFGPVEMSAVIGPARPLWTD